MKSTELRKTWGARALAAQDKYQFQWWAVSLVNAVPFGGKKKGADSGVDGLIYFKPEGKTTEKAGYYETLYGKYPKIQRLNIEELFAGKQPNIPLVDSASFREATG